MKGLKKEMDPRVKAALYAFCACESAERVEVAAKMVREDARKAYLAALDGLPPDLRAEVTQTVLLARQGTDVTAVSRSALTDN